MDMCGGGTVNRLVEGWLRWSYQAIVKEADLRRFIDVGREDMQIVGVKK